MSTAEPFPPPLSTLRQSYLGGCVVIIVAGLILSLGVLCIRGAGASDPFQYLFWRAVGFTAAVSLIAVHRHRISPFAQLRRMRGFAWTSAVAMVASQVTFIAAVKTTTVAEVFFLCSLAPLMAAVIALPLLGERIGPLGGVAIAIALGGVALMSGGGFHGGGWDGRALALAAALSFALYTLATRGTRPEQLDGALIAVGVLTAMTSLAVVHLRGLSVVVPSIDIGLALLHGGVILAAGLVMFAHGSRVVPGVTLTMLAQAEAVAAPIWTFFFFGETTTAGVVAGGALILIAVSLQAIDGARNAKGTP